VLLYELCALKPPFMADKLHFLAMKIVKGAYTPLPSFYSKELRFLVDSLLKVDPSKRPSVAQILSMPIIQSRIKTFLSESQRITEFSHTILHKQMLVDVRQQKLDELKRVNKEEPMPVLAPKKAMNEVVAKPAKQIGPTGGQPVQLAPQPKVAAVAVQGKPAVPGPKPLPKDALINGKDHRIPLAPAPGNPWLAANGAKPAALRLEEKRHSKPALDPVRPSVTPPPNHKLEKIAQVDEKKKDVKIAPKLNGNGLPIPPPSRHDRLSIVPNAGNAVPPPSRQGIVPPGEERKRPQSHKPDHLQAHKVREPGHAAAAPSPPQKGAVVKKGYAVDNEKEAALAKEKKNTPHPAPIVKRPVSNYGPSKKEVPIVEKKNMERVVEISRSTEDDEIKKKSDKVHQVVDVDVDEEVKVPKPVCKEAEAQFSFGDQLPADEVAAKELLQMMKELEMVVNDKLKLVSNGDAYNDAIFDDLPPAEPKAEEADRDDDVDEGRRESLAVFASVGGEGKNRSADDETFEYMIGGVSKLNVLASLHRRY
jgi:hypothetical protein